MNETVLNKLERRLGGLHARQRLGIETDHGPHGSAVTDTKRTQLSCAPPNGAALNYLVSLSRPPDRINAAEWVGQLYADEVISYGKLRSRREIANEHRLYTEQWPERSYSIQDKSMNAVCGESGPGPAQPVSVECIVTGTMEWKGRNVARNVAASGLSTFTYVLRSSGDTFIIKEVDAVPRRPTTYTTAY
jgi:hypothetical protein